MAVLTAIGTTKLIALLSSADPRGELTVSIDGSSRLALSKGYSEPLAFIDLGTEAIIQQSPAHRSDPQIPGTPAIVQVDYEARRATGAFWAEIEGDRIPAGSQKELLIRCLIHFEQKKPGTLESLARDKGRTKRIVSRDRSELYASARLERYAERILDGWWVATNNSRVEMEQHIRRAARNAGVSSPVRFG